MKKLLAFVISMIFVLFSLAACGSGGDLSDATSTTEPDAVSAELLEEKQQPDQDMANAAEAQDNKDAEASEEENAEEAPGEFDPDKVEMQATPNSSCFSNIGYDSLHNVLILTFRDSGASYLYREVPESVWNDLCAASSMGKFYNASIKGNYPDEKLQ